MSDQTKETRPLTVEEQNAIALQQMLKNITGTAIAQGPQAGAEALAGVLNSVRQQAFQQGLESRHVQQRQGELVLKNQKNNAEILRITMDGRIFVDGEEEVSSELIGLAVMDWQKAAMAESKKPEGVEETSTKKIIKKARRAR